MTDDVFCDDQRSRMELKQEDTGIPHIKSIPVSLRFKIFYLYLLPR